MQQSHADIVESQQLAVEGLEEVLVFKMTYRHLKTLKYIYQTEVLGKQNGTIFNFSDAEYKSYFRNFHGTLDSIENISFYEMQLGIERFRKNKIPFQGDFILAYLDGRFFKLKGFRYNDFSELFFRYITPGSKYISPYVSLELDRTRSASKKARKVVELIEIPELDISRLYKRHVKKQEFREEYSSYSNNLNWINYPRQ
jgi:hypothetical protein